MTLISFYNPYLAMHLQLCKNFHKELLVAYKVVNHRGTPLVSMLVEAWQNPYASHKFVYHFILVCLISYVLSLNTTIYRNFFHNKLGSFKGALNNWSLSGKYFLEVKTSIYMVNIFILFFNIVIRYQDTCKYSMWMCIQKKR